jgi:hypothetical protein
MTPPRSRRYTQGIPARLGEAVKPRESALGNIVRTGRAPNLAHVRRGAASPWLWRKAATSTGSSTVNDFPGMRRHDHMNAGTISHPALMEIACRPDPPMG